MVNRNIIHFYEMKKSNLSVNILRSAVFPGWGHFEVKQYTRGEILLGLEELYINEKLKTDDGSYEDISEDLVSETWYYYIISAVNSIGLEGVRSEPLFNYFIDESTQ